MARVRGFAFALTMLPMVAASLWSGPTHAAALSVPSSHPRLWYDARPGSPGFARLQRARAFAVQNPVPIPGWSPSDRARQLALRSLVRGQTDPSTDADCQQAVQWLKGFTMNVGGVSSDQARWDGENAILVYDWCHYALTDDDLHDGEDGLVPRWNGYVATLNAKPWGGFAMPANNYFWGYLRNGLLWGMASYHDGGAAQRATAQGFIDHALDLRYSRWPAANARGRDLGAAPPPANGSRFRTWHQAFGVGGVPLEGTQYGPYMLSYPAIAFTSAKDSGYNAWNAVPFWRHAVYHLHYAATPAATRARDGATPRFEMFPFNDDEFFADGGSAEGTGYADFLAAMVLRNPGVPLARQALSWMQLRGSTPSWWLRAELAAATVTPAAPTLPLDYYADGAQFLYGRRDAGGSATAFMLQLGGANAYTSNVSELAADGGVGHSHQDLGNFQLWRKGRWLTRETTGYNIHDDGIVGWNNGAVVDPLVGVAHNAALFEGRGQIYTRRGWARVLRLQSAPGFAYAAVDMTESYRAPAHESWFAEDDWPFAEVAIREFVYLRALDALVVLDRMKSGSDSLDPIYDVSYDGPQMPGTQVRKSFVLHATGTGAGEDGNPFVLGAAQATATVGDQRLDLRTLLPANPAYRVIAEGGRVGQFRLEYDVSGSEMSYLLNVVGVRDAADAPVSAAVSDIGDAWQLTLTHPVNGSATLLLRKGEGSTGGSVRIGEGPVQPLLERVQAMSITANGPVWGNGASPRLQQPVPAPAPHPPGGGRRW